MTHTLCQSCMDKGLYEDAAHLTQARRLGEMYGRLRVAARSRELLRAGTLMDECIGMGVRPVDLMMGIIQPLLYEIGELWARAEVTVAAEHQFSDFAASVLATVYQRYPELGQFRQSPHPRMLLTIADGNYHVLGLQILELYLATEHVPTFTVVPGLPVEETARLAREMEPGFIGVSISDPAQMRCARDLAAALGDLPDAGRPTIILGGSTARAGLDAQEYPGVVICANLADLAGIGVL